MIPAPGYGDRERRAARLQAGRPHSSELLGFYRKVLGLQEKVYREATVAPWGESSAGLRDLPWEILAESLRSFAGELAPLAPEPTRVAGERLVAGASESLRGLLSGLAEHESIAEPAAALGVEEAHAGLYARAFLQPWAEAARRRGDSGAGDLTPESSLCPACSWPAQVSVLQDEGEIRGQRSLVCALCGSGWSSRRQRCAHCGEENPERLALHEAEGLAHVQVESCASCRRYLKRVDLRRFGKAVPVVEDLATPELDLWARERELEKICPNLLGI